jgi:hypothetical protein
MFNPPVEANGNSSGRAGPVSNETAKPPSSQQIADKGIVRKRLNQEIF